MLFLLVVPGSCRQLCLSVLMIPADERLVVEGLIHISPGETARRAVCSAGQRTGTVTEPPYSSQAVTMPRLY